MANEFFFMPWVRTALAAAAHAPVAGDGLRRVLPIAVRVFSGGVAQGPDFPSEVALYGASDVLGIDPSVITRVEPCPGSGGFEPSYFPHVEFADADLPWRYSLDTSRGPRACPWLALIALQETEFEPLPPTGAPLPAIRVSPNKSLPDLAHAWAWAHVQVDRTRAGEGAAVQDLLRSDPTAHFARLLCPRRLESGRSYALFLVPVYEAGRRAGLGEPGTPDPWDALAWGAVVAPVTLPYYARWDLVTSDDHDFESLVRRIAAVDLSRDGSGGPLLGREVLGGDPGYYADYAEDGLTFVPEGALQPASPRAEFRADGLTPRLVRTLRETLATDADPAVDTDDPATADPLFALPVYGQTFRRGAEIVAPGAEEWPPRDPWLSEVNLDRRYRLAAGRGARLVRQHQEELMARCWAQAGDAAAANRLVVHAQTARELHRNMVARHLAPLAPEIGLALSERALPAVRGPDDGRPLSATLRAYGLPAGVAGIAERKVLAKRPERAPSAPGSRRAEVLAIPALPLPERSYGEPADRPATREDRESVRASWGFTVAPHLDRVHEVALLEAARARPVAGFVMKSPDVTGLREVITARLGALPVVRLKERIPGLGEATADALDPLVVRPRLADPLAAYLAKESPEDLVPGVRQLPPESAGLLVENRRYVSAFLLGCNDEMNRELMWREFPGDGRTTVFARFWERGAAAGDRGADDIRDISKWQGELGGDALGTGMGGIVVVLRSTLVRRHPGLRMLLNRQRLESGAWDPARGEDYAPTYSGTLGADLMFSGFAVDRAALAAALDEFFLVVHEAPGRYRFGLDVATHDARARADALDRPLATWADLSWKHVKLTPSSYVDFGNEVHPASGDEGQWGPGRHSASIASITFQHPFRIVLEARRLLGHA